MGVDSLKKKEKTLIKLRKPLANLLWYLPLYKIVVGWLFVLVYHVHVVSRQEDSLRKSSIVQYH